MSAPNFDIPVEIAGVKFRNPFFVASGPTTMRLEQIKKIEETGWGGASLKLTLDPPPYINRKPRYGYYPKDGYLTFTAEKRLTLDQLLKLIDDCRRETSKVVLFSNITYAGEEGAAGWVNMAKQCENAGVHINELNMCCPNMSFNCEVSGADKGGPKTGASLGQNEAAIAEIVSAIKAETSIPLFVKITPEGGNQPAIARAAFEAGADAVGSNGNRLAVPPIDLDNPTGSMYHLQKEIGMACMNSRWLLPLGKRDVYQIRKEVGPEYNITACGGVTEWRDAVEMAMSGADLVGICAATLIYGYGFMPAFVKGVQEFMREHGYKNWGELRDHVVPAITSAPDLTLYAGHAQKKDPHLAAPCRDACPMQLPIQGFLKRVSQKQYREAYELIQANGPFQEVCSRICDHPCETACVRRDKDASLNIMGIKRFVMDTARKNGWSHTPQILSEDGSAVAVIGAGPAGLSAAYHLSRAGHQVTVYEQEEKAGGTVRAHIPGFRLDCSHLDSEAQKLTDMGVVFQYGTALGKEVTLEGLMGDGCKAVFLATGAQQGIIPAIEGIELDGCATGVQFLEQEADLAGQRIVVVGGGFTAVDAARTALRRGAADVFILYRRTRDEMPASSQEVMEAEEEGVRLIYLAAPVLIYGEGKVEGVKAVVNTLSNEITKGRRRPVALDESQFDLAADQVVFAVSQQPIIQLPGVDQDEKGLICVDASTAASMPMVFAGGDCVTGPIDIISAVRGGRNGAAAIDQALRGEDAVLNALPELTVVDREAVLNRSGDIPRRFRQETRLRSADERRTDYDDPVITFTEEEAASEAARCLGCGCGAGCEVCSDICTVFAWECKGGDTILDQENCVACGMCIWRCPNDNIEMVQTSDQPV